MNVAICLYGQPRDFESGYQVIQDLIKKNNNCKFDFFYHIWFNNQLEKTYYISSNYRNIDKEELIIEKDTLEKIKDLYKSKVFFVETPIEFNIDEINKSLMSKKMSNLEINNINNCISNIYSKYKSSLALKQYVDKSNINYDLVISIRFDFKNFINLNLNNLNLDKIYTTNNKKIYINDSIVITNYNNFLLYSNAFKNIDKIINNIDIEQKSINMIGGFTFIPECFMTCNLLYYNLYDKIDTNHNIPNFM